MKRVELLSPAKDIAIGMAAINHGADAVYIGAPAFGARKAAGNSLEDLRKLIEYAHRFYCKVFVTLNTILYDDELPEAERLIREIYGIGADALIIQDPGILKLDIPPISLHASTQMHNYDLERIKFLDRLGFQRIVLARELSLEQLRIIRREVKAELEMFIHGALCVSLSGQCYLSQYMFGRSANRGECAQPCRMKWSVKDSSGKVLVRDKYVLSLKDLNLSAYMDELIDAGIDSFKIEGRLKDENYVSNVTAYYSSLIDRHPGVERVGTGRVISTFEADPERSFNRGYSDYFVEKRKRGLVNMDTPKSMGKPIGTVKQSQGNRLRLELLDTVNNGDGLCYIEKGELKGIRVNGTEGEWVICNEAIQVKAGTLVYRNYDHRFVMQTVKSKTVRKIRVSIEALACGGKLQLKATDEDGVTALYGGEETFEIATNPNQAERLKQQLAKCGDTDFECEHVDYKGEVLFVPAGTANAARRNLLDRLTEQREKQREVVRMSELGGQVAVRTDVDWKFNVVNHLATEFYQQHGAQNVEPGFEKGSAPRGRDLMHTRYCLLYELGRCRKLCKNEDLQFPLFLYNDKHRFQLEFDCQACFMKVRPDK